jgi:hypothetical protein
LVHQSLPLGEKEFITAVVAAPGAEPLTREASLMTEFGDLFELATADSRRFCFALDIE